MSAVKAGTERRFMENINIVLIAAVVILLFGMFNGLRKGLVRAVFSTFIIFASLAVAAFASPYAAKLLKTTPVYDGIHKQVTAVISQELETTADNVTEQIDAIHSLPFPESIKDSLIENNNGKIYEALGITDFAAYVADYITMMIVKAAAFVILFILAFIILKIIEVCLSAVVSLPVLNSLNKLGGFLFGAVNGLMTIWFFFIIITAFAGTSWGMEIFKQINGSALLSFLYNNNYLMAVIVNLGKMLM